MATWHQPHWQVSAGLTRAADWINYDRQKLARDFADTTLTAEGIVTKLRADYWMHYDGVTRLRASFSRDLTSNFSFTMSGDNLTNVQRGEPDNITVLPGRTILFGVTAKIR
jgi:iron complex outermembrane receptor protein